MGGIPISSNCKTKSSGICASSLHESVERFTEQAYFSGSSIDGMKLVLDNTRAKSAYIKFLRESNLKHFLCFNDLEALCEFSPLELASSTKMIIDRYKSPSTVSHFLSDSNATDAILGDIEYFLSDRNSSSINEIKGAIYCAINDIKILMALNVFPRFIGSGPYKEWRRLESDLISKSSLESVSILNESIDDGTSDIHYLMPSSCESELIDDSLNFIHPQNIRSVCGSGSWLGTLISAAEGLPICVTLADANPLNPGFPLIYVNKAFESTTGYKRERIRGTSCRFLQNQKTEPEGIAALSRALASAQPVEVTLTNFRCDGTPFRNRIALKPIFDTNKNYCFVVGVQFDISTPSVKSNHSRMMGGLLSLLPDVVV